jgi:hypothetical protein
MRVILEWLYVILGFWASVQTILARERLWIISGLDGALSICNARAANSLLAGVAAYDA